MTRLLSYNDLRARGIPYSKVHLWRLERDGKFPKRIKIGAKFHGWKESEIDELLTHGARPGLHQGYKLRVIESNDR